MGVRREGRAFREGRVVREKRAGREDCSSRDGRDDDGLDGRGSAAGRMRGVA